MGGGISNLHTPSSAAASMHGGRGRTDSESVQLDDEESAQPPTQLLQRAVAPDRHPVVPLSPAPHFHTHLGRLITRHDTHDARHTTSWTLPPQASREAARGHGGHTVSRVFVAALLPPPATGGRLVGCCSSTRLLWRAWLVGWLVGWCWLWFVGLGGGWLVGWLGSIYPDGLSA